MIALAPLCTGPRQPRFRHVGGDVIEATGRRVGLQTAEELAGAWSRQALRWQEEGRLDLARLFARDALDIGLAASAASAWRRASGPLTQIMPAMESC